MNAIYAYTDYREYIRDFLIEKQKKNTKYSSRCAAEKCGVPSGTFTRILKGTRGIGPSLLPKFINWLGLKHREAHYFQILVKFQHSTATIDRDNFYEELLTYRSQMRHLIPEDKFHFFEQWYHIALYELMKILSKSSQPEQIGALLEPPVSGTKIQKAIEVLEKAGFIKNSPQGFSPVDNFLSTGDTWESAAIHAFQKIMCSLGTESLDRFPKNERDISTLSMGLSEESFRKVVDVIRDARQKIKEIEKMDSAAERVYQINFQVFPLSRRHFRGNS